MEAPCLKAAAPTRAYMRKSLIIGIAGASSVLAQTMWEKSEQRDTFRDKTVVQFELKGSFLTPPSEAAIGAPSLIAHCEPGKHLLTNGKFLDAFVLVGAVVGAKVELRQNAIVGSSSPVVVPVQYRLDGGKVQREEWKPREDHRGAYFKDSTLNNLLFGHTLPHKPGSGDAIRKATIALDEFMHGEVVMQFEMPNPDQIADACGVTYVNRKK